MTQEHIYLWLFVGAFIFSLLMAYWGYRSGLTDGRRPWVEKEENEPPQPTISLEAMKRTDVMERVIGHAAQDRVWATTAVTNNRGMAHVGNSEMGDLCDAVERAAMEVINGWLPPAAGEGTEK